MKATFNFTTILGTTYQRATEKVGNMTIEITGEKNRWSVGKTEYFPKEDKSVFKNTTPVGVYYETKERAINKANYLYNLASQNI